MKNNPWIRWFVLYMAFAGGNHAIYTMALPIRTFHHIIITVVILWWLFEYGLPPTWMILPLLAFCIPLGLSVIYSIDSRMALENAWHWITNMLLFLILIDWIRQDRANTVFKWQFYAGVFLVGYSLVEFILYGGRPAGPFFNINLVGAYAAAMVIPALAWSEEHKWLKWLAGGLVLLVLINASRGAWLSLGIAGLVYGFFRVKTPIARVGMVGMLGAVVLGVVLVSGQSGRISGDTLRLNLMRAGMDMLEKHAWGVGPGLYGQAVREYDFRLTDNMAGAHNQVINLAAELGGGVVFGAGTVLTAVALSFTSMGRFLTRRVQGVIAALCGIGVHLMVDGSLSSNFAFLVGLYVAYLVAHDQTFPQELHQPLRAIRIPIALGLVVFMVGLLKWDTAQYYYEQSLATGSQAAAQQAVQLDADLRLYRMNLARLQDGPAYALAFDETLTEQSNLGIYSVVSYGRYWR